ncbi:MAG: Dam family site-specific DNA-(adenine-N6)-methyltransferase [Termitinemataceae bacterium]|nr:MAG: Dam family site-specific DNA-(adenine-N6)-methyltransferase [Termitinemataceae bacterium]
MPKTIIPPIKSQGIKTKLVPWICAVIPQNTGRWIEPFMGTGVVAFNVGFKEALLSDINPHLINFYNAIKEEKITPVIVKQYLEKEGGVLRIAANDGGDHYKFIRERFNEYFNSMDFLFLSRAGFNGMIRFNSKGKWNIPFCKKPDRFSKAYITKIVNQVARVSEKIKENWIFTNKDFRAIISLANENDVIYCDPPYHGRYVDYYNGWTDDDERDLYELLAKTKARFILSTWHHNDFRRNEMVEKYWNNFNIITKDHFYHSGGKIENRNSIVEALVFNFETDIIKHNYEPVKVEKQFVLFEKPASSYYTEKLKEIINQ